MSTVLAQIAGYSIVHMLVVAIIDETARDREIMVHTIGLLLLTALSLAAGCVWECRSWEVKARAAMLETWPDGSDDR